MRQARRAAPVRRPTTPRRRAAERYELQELSAVASERYRQLLPAHRREPAGARARDPRHHQFPGELPPASQAARLRREAPRRASPRAAPIDWAFGEALAFGTLALEGTPCASAGRIPAAARSASATWRSTIPRPASATSRMQHISPDQARFDVLRQLAERIRRAGFRIRLQRGRSADAGDLGSAVRRFRQRRADHDRPVHLLRRIRSGASRAAW